MQGAPCYVNPLDDETFPGISETVKQLQSWEWIYAKTPEFRVKRGFLQYVDGLGFHDVDIEIQVSHGRIKQVTLESKSLQTVVDLEKYFNAVLKSQRFCKATVVKRFDSCADVLCDVESSLKVSWIKNLITQNMIGHVYEIM